MPKEIAAELDDTMIEELMKRAEAVVSSNFDPKEHLPEKIYEFLRPICAATCQGYYAVAMMLLGSMPAITNGASVPLWNQKATPLCTMVFQIGKPQGGKSRLTPIIEEIFDTCDDCVEELVEEMVKDSQEEANGGRGREHVEGEDDGEPPCSVTVTSIALQSFTFTEFFFRCSSAFPQIKKEGKTSLLKKVPSRVWYGVGANLDEAYEFLDGLGMLSAKADQKSSPGVHASTLNLLIGSGKTRRATRTSTSFGQSRAKHVALSIVGNAHPTKMIPLERGLIGNHTAATKERVLFCLDTPVPRHAPLPADVSLGAGVSVWTWLPLTVHTATVFGWSMFYNSPERAEDLEEGDPVENSFDAIDFIGPAEGYKLNFPDGTPSRIRFVRPHADEESAVRTEYRISARWRMPDPAAHVKVGAKRVVDFFKKRPHDTIKFTDSAHKLMLGNQVAQSIRAQVAGSDSTAAAQNSAAAGQMGVVAACLAVLDVAAGGGRV